jgi:hypothetical protein
MTPTPPSSMHAGTSERWFRRLDANKDGVVTPAERGLTVEGC